MKSSFLVPPNGFSVILCDTFSIKKAIADFQQQIRFVWMDLGKLY
jgi:hypothetical protein